MTSNNEYLTDDYVAEVLVKEAKDASLKYSAMGLDAFKTNKRPASQMKPNTRFLQNLLKGTESHNTALLAKEAAESQARLQELSDAEDARRRKYKPEPTDIRKRQLGNIKSILGGAPSRRADGWDANGSGSRLGKDSTSERQMQREGRRDEDSPNSDRPDSRRKRQRRSSDDDESENNGSEKSKSRRHRHRGYYSESEDDSRRHRKRHRERSRSPSPRSREKRRRRAKDHDRSERTAGDDVRSTKPRDQHKKRSISDQRTQKSTDYTSTIEEESDSDLIGPAAPSESSVRRRGRGAASGHSGIDRRFSETYDPKDDVDDEQEDADWDGAVEAYRARQKWKEKGVARLRKAGFSEPAIWKWESGSERRPEDVQWTRKGEKREWDRGKVIGPDGSVTVTPNWAKDGDDA